jgi:hypothetical protein
MLCGLLVGELPLLNCARRSRRLAPFGGVIDCARPRRQDGVQAQAIPRQRAKSSNLRVDSGNIKSTR